MESQQPAADSDGAIRQLVDCLREFVAEVAQFTEIQADGLDSAANGSDPFFRNRLGAVNNPPERTGGGSGAIGVLATINRDAFYLGEIVAPVKKSREGDGNV